MPNIPNLPGVPALTSYSVVGAIFLVADTLRAFLGPVFSRWGIYLDGLPVIPLGSTITFDYSEDYTISNYPQERGAFQSYNKVQVPSRIKTRVARGGSDAERSEFLTSIALQMRTTELYDVLTPEGVFSDYNFIHQDQRREASRGLGLVTVDVHLEQVRLSATSEFTNTQNPTEAGRQGLGNLQGQPVAGVGGAGGFSDPRLAGLTPSSFR